MTDAARHRVVVLALPGAYPFELGIPQRIFGVLPEHYEVLTCTADGAPVRSSGGFLITTEHGPEALEAADTVVVPPFDRATAMGPAVAALGRVRPGTRLVSICTGAFALAAAGLLDGRPATTHWRESAAFRSLFPAVALDQDVLFVDDGDVLTSAGAAAGVDVCLHVVRRDLGSQVANHVARICVVPPWREGGQAQYVEHPVPDRPLTSTSATRQWAVAHLHRPLTQADLARHAHMSLRTFARRFGEEVGTSPGRWIVQQRVAAARELLESSDLTVEEIAGRVGFATAASLRQHLHESIGVAPLAYRRTFRGLPV